MFVTPSGSAAASGSGGVSEEAVQVIANALGARTDRLVDFVGAVSDRVWLAKVRLYLEECSHGELPRWCQSRIGLTWRYGLVPVKLEDGSWVLAGLNVGLGEFLGRPVKLHQVTRLLRGVRAFFPDLVIRVATRHELCRIRQFQGMLGESSYRSNILVRCRGKLMRMAPTDLTRPTQDVEYYVILVLTPGEGQVEH